MKKPTPFLTERQIAKRVKELGETIARDHKGKGLACIGVLKGSFVFFADLIRNIDLPVTVDFLGTTSYGQQTRSSGDVKITLDLSVPITGKHVLLVEDIVDTGHTLHYLLENLRLRKPASLRLCVLLLKPGKLLKPVPIDYLGFTIDDRFVVGYGLDARERYRNLPYIAELPESAREEE
ncbi:MAG TPA: hypoxanthine phosphoribosyltransferase [Bdellovibrionota bacterium]|nr:hypoxanthine phosphoribosyltransferase [Bdellovibrionota bacterium]